MDSQASAAAASAFALDHGHGHGPAGAHPAQHLGREQQAGSSDHSQLLQQLGELDPALLASMKRHYGDAAAAGVVGTHLEGGGGAAADAGGSRGRDKAAAPDHQGNANGAGATHGRLNDDGGALNPALAAGASGANGFAAFALHEGFDPGYMLQHPQGHPHDVHLLANFHNPYQQLRVHCLPVLDNLSSQVLAMLTKGPYQQTLVIVTQPASDQGQAYRTLMDLFNSSKRAYSQEAFLDPDSLDLKEPQQRCTIRKVNLATFVSSVFGSTEVGFYHLNENFLTTFVPEKSRLLKSQAALFLDLKTQAFISAMCQGEKEQSEILEDLFPDNMEHQFRLRRHAKQLTPTEQDFCARCKSRRENLARCGPDFNLAEKYIWQGFLKDITEYVSENYESIIANGPKKRRPRQSTRDGPPTPEEEPHQHAQPQQQHQEEEQQMEHEMVTTPSEHVHVGHEHDEDAGMHIDSHLFADGGFSLDQPLDPNQSTAELYEEARMAATRNPASSKKASGPTQRRPWSKEEEQALLNGLDAVKGPHWSQILSMYGAGGTVSEILKDRNQVQLKDKARNLKLFFLKSQLDVPYYLKVSNLG